MTSLGSLSFQKVCVMRIQRLWRGFIVRKHYRHRLRQYYKEGRGDENRRKQFFEKEFITYNQKIDKTVEDRSNQVNSLLR